MRVENVDFDILLIREPPPYAVIVLLPISIALCILGTVLFEVKEHPLLAIGPIIFLVLILAAFIHRVVTSLGYTVRINRKAYMVAATRNLVVYRKTEPFRFDDIHRFEAEERVSRDGRPYYLPVLALRNGRRIVLEGGSWNRKSVAEAMRAANAALS